MFEATPPSGNTGGYVSSSYGWKGKKNRRRFLGERENGVSQASRWHLFCCRGLDPRRRGVPCLVVRPAVWTNGRGGPHSLVLVRAVTGREREARAYCINLFVGLLLDGRWLLVALGFGKGAG